MQKPLEGIDQVQEIIEYNNQDFAEVVPPPNKLFPEEN